MENRIFWDKIKKGKIKRISQGPIVVPADLIGHPDWLGTRICFPTVLSERMGVSPASAREDGVTFHGRRKDNKTAEEAESKQKFEATLSMRLKQQLYDLQEALVLTIVNIKIYPTIVTIALLYIFNFSNSIDFASLQNMSLKNVSANQLVRVWLMQIRLIPTARTKARAVFSAHRSEDRSLADPAAVGFSHRQPECDYITKALLGSC